MLSLTASERLIVPVLHSLHPLHHDILCTFSRRFNLLHNIPSVVLNLSLGEVVLPESDIFITKGVNVVNRCKRAYVWSYVLNRCKTLVLEENRKVTSHNRILISLFRLFLVSLWYDWNSNPLLFLGLHVCAVSESQYQNGLSLSLCNSWDCCGHDCCDWTSFCRSLKVTVKDNDTLSY
jgi:hypothetical protein